MLFPPRLAAGDRVAVLSPAFAAPAVAPALHEQAMRRIVELTGLVPVEYPATRDVNATPEARAADMNAAFADPSIRAILATIGGELDLTEPGKSEDVGKRWDDLRALTEDGDRVPTEAWTWAGPRVRVEGRTWGGCLEVIDELALADRLPTAEELEGLILLVETT